MAGSQKRKPCHGTQVGEAEVLLATHRLASLFHPLPTIRRKVLTSPTLLFVFENVSAFVVERWKS